MAALMKDIAKATGFSITTVSLALNNSPRISKETKQRILDVAKQLNYTPNLVARSLATRQSRMIGLIVREFDSLILNKVAAMLESELAARGYGLVLVTTAPPRTETGALRMLESQQVDGIFMFPSLPPDRHVMEYIQKTTTPVVFLSYGKYEPYTDAVYYDREYSAYILTKHLLDLGHERIGLICGSVYKRKFSVDGERLNGYIRALSEKGIPFDMNDTHIPEGDNEYASGYNAALELTRRRDLTALVAATDPIACGAIRYFTDHGVSVPADMSIVSNDSSEVAQFAPVPVTASFFDLKTLVSNALPIMMSRIETPETRAEYRVIALKSRLDIRESSAVNTRRHD